MTPSKSYAYAVWGVSSIAGVALVLLLASGMGHGGGSLGWTVIISLLVSSIASVVPAVLALLFFEAGSAISKRKRCSGSTRMLGAAASFAAAAIASAAGARLHSLQALSYTFLAAIAVFSFLAPFATGERDD